MKHNLLRLVTIFSTVIFSIAINAQPTHTAQHVREETKIYPIIKISPKYPVLAAREGVEGYVTLSFDVTKAGTVDNIKVVSSLPEGTFEKEAINALKKWRYNIADEVKYNIEETLHFTLK
ncbi:MAG: energy transducer TonB [Colwellia sp.]